MSRPIFIVFVLLGATVFSSASWASRSSDPLDPQNLKRKIQGLRSEILDMRRSIENLESEHRGLVVDLANYELKFQERFSKVVVPLLSWPSLPPAVQRASFIEESHLRYVLLKTRERVIQEPLKLIAERELMISRVNQNKEDLTSALKRLEDKESLLNLQVEELQFLQKKLSKVKKG